MITGLIIVSGLIIWCSICEWCLHKFVMHNPPFGFTYAYKAHTKVHHNVFKYDETYHVQNNEDIKTIPMAKWNGIVISIMVGIPMLVFGYKMFLMAFIVSMGYYGVYEVMHWYMHLPRGRRIERMGVFRRMNGHHILHHRYMNKNYNVVLPFADLVFGTLMMRSSVKFKQVKESYCVPDVQPKRK